ncbi:MAG: hypothetical protein GC199_00265 [Alphaproteobacteria bacterium]|nr:hypothetical protein [Alphaproteobacteria bacterium]
MARIAQDAVFLHSLAVPDAIASYRYASLIPAAQLGCRVLDVPEGEAPAAFLDRVAPGLLVLGKPHENERCLDVAEEAKRRGIPIISWFCDLHIGDAIAKRVSRQIALSDAHVVQTEAMAGRLADQLPAPATIIEEALEYPPGAVRFAPEPGALKLLWYGGAANFATLPKAIRSLSATGLPSIALTIVANQPPPSVRDLAAKGLPRHLRIGFVPWSRAMQFQAMARSDIIIVPSDDGETKLVKGHNRVTEALNAGRVTIAHPLPQYLELAPHLFLARDMDEGLRAVLADRHGAAERTARGQAAVRARFAPEIVAQKWAALIARVGGAAA